MELRNPKFGNVYFVDTNVLVSRSLDGENLLVRDSNWPIIERFQVSIDPLTDAEAETMLQFYASVAGQIITIIDHENLTWEGIIITENPEVVQLRPGCGYETEFEFEGSILTVFDLDGGDANLNGAEIIDGGDASTNATDIFDGGLA